MISFVIFVGMGCVPGLSTFESARQEMLQYTGFTVDVVHCCELELATTAVEAALQTVAHLAASSKLQDALLKAGVIWSVCCALSIVLFVSKSSILLNL
jgi:hypothetical protein